MQVIIPMSGEGKRFREKGYQNLKPLIEVNGKPFIQYVIEMFSPEDEFIFIARHDHIEQYRLDEKLKSLVSNSRLLPIQPHKLGPIHAVLQAESMIDSTKPSIVSYCDYFMKWDYAAFKNYLAKTPQDGNVICYTGFHPHLLHEKNVYAGCRVDAELNLLEIREKYSFEKDKTKGYHSAGMYYFKDGATLLTYFKKVVSQDLAINGEYYASIPFQVMVEDGMKVKVYDQVSHFCQWGTPEDFEEFLYWKEIFEKY